MKRGVFFWCVCTYKLLAIQACPKPCSHSTPDSKSVCLLICCTIHAMHVFQSAGNNASHVAGINLTYEIKEF